MKSDRMQGLLNLMKSGFWSLIYTCSKVQVGYVHFVFLIRTQKIFVIFKFGSSCLRETDSDTDLDSKN
jgi:hypothetical protein